MSKFWELLEESVILQSLITLLVIGAVVGLVIADKPVPDLLDRMAHLVVGFYFGSKLLVTSARVAERAVNRVLWQEGSDNELRSD